MCYLQTSSYFDFVIVYEDLLDNPQDETEKLFRKFGIPQRHIANVLTALNKDSQMNFFQNSGQKSKVFSPEQWQKIENVFRQLKVPISYSMTLNEFRAVMQNS